MFILPNTNTNICGNHYGYQAGKGTEFCWALLNDCVAYFNEGGSPVYMCTLDAVKCFYNIWHEGVFYKLWNRMDIVHWRLLYNWYKFMRVTVLLNVEYREFFSFTKGTRQGSMLSPYLFNIFIDELMENLESSPYGIRIDSLSLYTAGYADDITLIASTVTDLQQLVNICYHYSCKWRFVFGPFRSKCIKMYKRISAPMESPDIWSGSNKLEFANNVDILGRVFSNNLSSQDHIDVRICNSRRAMYSIGLNNQARSPFVKAYLWRSIGTPSLMYAIGTCNISSVDLKRLESFQGTIIKNSVYLGKRCHHSALLEALHVSGELWEDMERKLPPFGHPQSGIIR